MTIQDISAAEIRVATGLIDQTGRIAQLDEIGECNRIMLPLAFVENHPTDNRWMVPT